MDIIIYMIILIGIGVYKIVYVKAPQTIVSSDIGVSNTEEVQQSSGDLKVGNNLKLLKEKDAYMLIIEALGLRY